MIRQRLHTLAVPCTFAFQIVDRGFGRILAQMQQRGIVHEGLIRYGSKREPLAVAAMDWLRFVAQLAVAALFAAPVAVAYLLVIVQIDFAWQQHTFLWFLAGVPGTFFFTLWRAMQLAPSSHMFMEACLDNTGWRPLAASPAEED